MADAATELKTMLEVGFGAKGSVPSKGAGTFKEYRRMRNSPTIALAIAVATSAIRSSEWSFESDEGVEDWMVKFASDTILPLRSELVRQGAFSLHYGFQEVYTPLTMNKDGLFVPEFLRPILPEDVKSIEVDERSLKVTGITPTKGDPIDASDLIHFVHDSEGGNPFGRSRHENIREFAWEPWKNKSKRVADYCLKQASLIPIVEHPLGVSQLEGVATDNSEIAQRILDYIPIGKGVRLPKILAPYAEQMIKNGAKPEEVMAWTIKFVECASGFGAEALELLKHDEALQMRGWLVPERTAIEGSNGTKAEAGEHANIMLETAQVDAEGIAQAVNDQLLQRLNVLNFGQSMKGKIRLKAAPINKERRAMLARIVEAFLTNPANYEVATSVFDLDGGMSELDLPKLRSVTNAPVVNPQMPGLSRRASGLIQLMARVASEGAD